MRASTVTCDAVMSDDKRFVVYAVKWDTCVVQHKFEDFERVYSQLKYLLPATMSSAPKKKFMQSENRLIEKRKAWITAMSQTLLSHPNNMDVREFYMLPNPEEEDHVDIGPKEKRSAKPGDFEFLSTMGKGSFGKVFQVRHNDTGRIYAMKVLSKEHIRKKNEVKHVMAELNVLKANIEHPFLVSLHYSFQTKEKLYFVLDHLNGGELFSHLQKARHFSEARARFYAADIASALGHLHDKNIIYRDLKPENLLLDRQGYIVLTDFGLCKENMGPKETTNTFCGTPEYLAPEIVQRKPYDRTVDWWCLGSVLYEMMFGLPPFYSKDHNEMYERIVNQPLTIRSDASPHAADLIKSLLQKDRLKRMGIRKDFEELREHAFFESINFDRLLAREIRPQFVPKLKDELDLNLIDSGFRNTAIPGSVMEQNLAQTQRDHDFPAFTFVQKPIVG